MKSLPSTSWRITFDDGETSAVYEPASSPGRGAVFVCAHGAGGHMSDGAMTKLAGTLRERGVSMVRFNFLYREKKSSRPDPMPRLESCISAVVAHTRREVEPDILIIGGRSMGGRAASMLAAKGFDCDGLFLLAYPLHPPGKPEQLRDAHLAAIEVPVLCVNGTRDPFCQRDLMEKALEQVGPNWQMHWVEGADHSFHVLKSSGTNDAAVLTKIGDAAERWIGGLRPALR